MNPRGVLAFISTVWTATAIAIPGPVPHNAPESALHGSIIDHNEPYYLSTKYGLNTSEEYKYFQEPGNDEINAHYDSRFFKEPVPKEGRAQTLTHIVQSYFRFFKDNDLETWIAHGTLLGWWWNGKIMPWDWDIDTQVSEATLFRLADNFNGTEVHYNTTDPDVQHSYLLDINPWARQRDRGMGLNIIDARWIDMKTGLYIDITGLSRLNKAKPNEWGCKNNHNYLINDIYPLRVTFFEGVAAKVPFRYEQVLTDEYQSKALTDTKYNHHTWDPKLAEWISDELLVADDKKEEEENDDRDYE
ncbi:LicD family-domain-containing protein [Aspergillus varians]